MRELDGSRQALPAFGMRHQELHLFTYLKELYAGAMKGVCKGKDIRRERFLGMGGDLERGETIFETLCLFLQSQSKLLRELVRRVVLPGLIRAMLLYFVVDIVLCNQREVKGLLERLDELAHSIGFLHDLLQLVQLRFGRLRYLRGLIGERIRRRKHLC